MKKIYWFYSVNFQNGLKFLNFFYLTDPKEECKRGWGPFNNLEEAYNDAKMYFSGRHTVLKIIENEYQKSLKEIL